MLNFGRVFLRPALEVGRSQTWRSKVAHPLHMTSPQKMICKEDGCLSFWVSVTVQGANCYRRYVLRLSRTKQKGIEFIYWNFCTKVFAIPKLSGNRETDHGTATKTNDSLCISPNGIIIIIITITIIIIFHKT